MEIIELENKLLDSSCIVHEDKKLNDFLNRSIIGVKLTNNYTIKEKQVYEKLPITTYNIIGNKLSLENNSIKIESDVSKISITFMVLFKPVITGRKYAQFFYDGKSTLPNLNYALENLETQIIQTPLILDVKKGAKLDFKVYGSAGDTIIGNRMFALIEVIE